MINTMFSLLFGCRHRRFTRPITPLSRFGNTRRDTYVSCLECGKEFHYDAVNMRMGSQIRPDISAEPTYSTLQPH
jgi:hypothetical protein